MVSKPQDEEEEIDAQRTRFVLLLRERIVKRGKNNVKKYVCNLIETCE